VEGTLREGKGVYRACVEVEVFRYYVMREGVPGGRGGSRRGVLLKVSVRCGGEV
jgi:hypothetical protein